MNTSFQYAISHKHFPGYQVKTQPIAVVFVTYNDKYEIERVDIGVSSQIIGKVANWERLASEIEERAAKEVELLKPLPARVDEEFESGTIEGEEFEEFCRVEAEIESMNRAENY